MLRLAVDLEAPEVHLGIAVQVCTTFDAQYIPDMCTYSRKSKINNRELIHNKTRKHHVPHLRRGITAKGDMSDSSDLMPKMPDFCLVLDW
jgi:hypothetical protein